MPRKVWDEITYPFPKFNGSLLKFGNEYLFIYNTFYNGFNYVSMLGLKLNHVSKRVSGLYVFHFVSLVAKQLWAIESNPWFRTWMRIAIPRTTICRGPFCKHGLTLILAWISNHMPRRVWEDNIYPVSNCSRAAAGVWEWISDFIT